MAKTIRGINVKIGSDTSGLQKALKDVNKRSRDIRSELRKVERLLKFNPKDTELLAQKQKLLSDRVENTREKLNRLRKAQDQVKAQYEKGEIDEGQYRAFQREIKKTESQLKHYKRQLDKSTSSLRKFKKRMQAASKSLRKAGKRMRETGQQLSMRLTAPLAAVSAAVVKVGMDFEDSLNQSIAIMGDVSDAMRNKMAQTAQDVAGRLDVSNKEAAESYFYLASAGLDATQSIKALPQVAEFATAGQFEMKEATDLLTDAQSALGLTVDDAAQNMENMAGVSDVLVKANTLANASVQQFSEALTNKAGAALRSVNKSIEEGAAVLSVFADQGVKGQKAGNDLSRTLRYLQDASQKNNETWKEKNLSLYDANGNMRNMADIVEMLTDHMKGLSDEQKAAELEALGFNARTRTTIKLLMGTSDQIREYQGELENAAGTTKSVAEKQMESLKKQLGLIVDRLKSVAIQMYDNLKPTITNVIIPAINNLTEKLEDVTEWFGDLEEETQGFILAGIGLAAALGPALIVLGGLATALGAILSPIGLVIAGIAGLGYAGYQLAKNWKDIKETLKTYWDLMAANFDNTRISILIGWNKLKQGIYEAVTDILSSLSMLEKLPVIGKKFEGLTDTIDEKSTDAAENIKNLKDEFQENQDKIGESTGKLNETFSTGYDNMKDVTTGFVDAMVDIFSSGEEDKTDAIEEALMKRNKALQKYYDNQKKNKEEEVEDTEETEEEKTELTEEQSEYQADVQKDMRKEMELGRYKLVEANKEAAEEEAEKEEEIADYRADVQKRMREQMEKGRIKAAQAVVDAKEKREKEITKNYKTALQKRWAARQNQIDKEKAAEKEQAEYQQNVQDSMMEAYRKGQIKAAQLMKEERKKRTENYKSALEKRYAAYQRMQKNKQILNTRFYTLARQNVIQYFSDLQTKFAQSQEAVQKFSQNAANKMVGFFDSISSGAKTFKEAMKDAVISVITMLEKQVIAQKLAGIASAWAQAPLTFGASLAYIGKIIAATAPAIAAFESAKAVIRGLETGGVVAGGSDQLFRLGDGREDEAVIPLNREVLGNLGNQIASNMGGGGSGPKINQENHYHYSEPLSPSQVAKKNEQQLKKLGIEWGLQT